jgi:WD40 repeat protein
MKEILFITGLSLFMMSARAQRVNEPYRFPTDEMIIYDICYTQNGGALGIADGKTVKVFSSSTHEMIREFNNGHTGQILSIDISKDSTILASGGKDSTCVLWDFMSGTQTGVVRYDGVIASVSISPDNNFLAFGGSGCKAVLYNIKKKKVDYLLTDHNDDITSLAFSPDGKYLATTGGDKRIYIYNVENGSLVGVIEDHKDWVRDLSFSPDGSKLITGGDDSKIIQWNISNINSIRRQKSTKPCNTWILGLDFHSDNITYAYGNLKGEVKIISQFVNYEIDVKAPVHSVLFKPYEEHLLKIAIATRGKGVLLVNAVDMRSR